ncbi:MAG: cardiolipin synthase [Anaerovoracaceae bacterium]|jgi:cardiolipin synthase
MGKQHVKTQQVFFGRTVIFVALLLIQLGLLGVLFVFTAETARYYSAVSTAIGFFLVVYIINREQNPAFKLAWIIPMLAVPVFGAFLFLFVQLQPGVRRISKKLQHIEEQTSLLNPQDPEILAYLSASHRPVANLSLYNKSCCGIPIYPAEDITYFPLGEDMWQQLLVDLANAKDFIFLEYFIIERGKMWDTIEDVLAERAAAGVEVRVLYDGIGSLTTLPATFPRELAARGIDSRPFLKAKPLLSTVQNNRDHRKIAVIDGKVAYTGGLNLADEYINHKEKYGHWKDNAIRMDGPAVDGFTTIFLELWHEGEDDPDYASYLIHPPQTRETGFVMPYGDNPFDDQTVAAHIYLDMIYGAEDYVHIMTPYLILDNETITALQYAAKRGVDTAIMMPHIPDKAYAYLLGRTYYPKLINAGVKIYEYTPGFVHAKTFVADGKKAVVGTTNLDYRSLYLHFECGAFIYDHPVVFEIEEDYQRTLAECQLITIKDCRRFPLWKRFAGRALRLIAPLM